LFDLLPFTALVSSIMVLVNADKKSLNDLVCQTKFTKSRKVKWFFFKWVGLSIAINLVFVILCIVVALAFPPKIPPMGPADYPIRNQYGR
jgi:hypothetical protein